VAVVYLRARPATLVERISQDDQPRPLLAPDPLDALATMHADRDDRYRALAQLTLDVEGRAPEALAAEVLEALGTDLVRAGEG
jgi:shikimate dehydrogenase